MESKIKEYKFAAGLKPERSNASPELLPQSISVQGQPSLTPSVCKRSKYGRFDFHG